MKRFQFRLEKVFEHKERLYEIAQGAHAEALAIFRREEAKRDALSEDYRACLGELSEKQKNAFRVRDLGPYYRYMTYLKKEIAAQVKVVEAARVQEQEKRKVLIAAAKEKEALQKLRTKQYNEYQYALNREEQKFLDDVAATAYVRMGGLRD